MLPTKRQKVKVIVIVLLLFTFVFFLITWVMKVQFASLAWFICLGEWIFISGFGTLLGLLLVRLIYAGSETHAKVTQSTTVAQCSTDTNAAIEFNLSADDLMAFYLFDNVHSPNIGRRHMLRRFFLVIYFIVFVLGIAVLLLFHEDQFLFVCGILVVLASILLFIWQLLAPIFLLLNINRRVAKLYSKTDKPEMKHIISISNEGLTHDVNTRSEKIPWTKIEAILSTEKYLYFYEQSASVAHIVPLTAFTDTVSFEKFEKAAKAYFAHALGNTNTKQDNLK